jgi:hypothetical protein
MKKTVLFVSDYYVVFFMCLVSIFVCVGSLWYLCCLLHVSCVYCCVCRFSLIFMLSSSCVLFLLLCVSVLSDIYVVLFMCLVSIVVCVGSLWYLFCLLHVSCVYCCVCRFSLIFILSSNKNRHKTWRRQNKYQREPTHTTIDTRHMKRTK